MSVADNEEAVRQLREAFELLASEARPVLRKQIEAILNPPEAEEEEEPEE